MELIANKSLKKEITKKIIKESKKLTFLKSLAIIVFFVAIILSCFYAVSMISSSTAHIVNVRGVPTKDFDSIITNTILFFVLGCFFSVIIKALLLNLSGKNINEREEESLIIMDDMVRYIFRTKNHSAMSSRIVMSIPFGNITSLEYFEGTKKVLIRGQFPCKYVEDYGTEKAKEFDEIEFEEFIIHDYFVPGFYENICNRIENK